MVELENEEGRVHWYHKDINIIGLMGYVNNDEENDDDDDDDYIPRGERGRY